MVNTSTRIAYPFAVRTTTACSRPPYSIALAGWEGRRSNFFGHPEARRRAAAVHSPKSMNSRAIAKRAASHQDMRAGDGLPVCTEIGSGAGDAPTGELPNSFGGAPAAPATGGGWRGATVFGEIRLPAGGTA